MIEDYLNIPKMSSFFCNQGKIQGLLLYLNRIEARLFREGPRIYLRINEHDQSSKREWRGSD